MATFLRQLRGLLWRNFLIKIRQWKLSAMEVLIPVLLVVVMILISLGTHSQITPAVPNFPAHNFSFTSFPPPSSKPILAAPDQPFTADVMDIVTRLLNVTARAALQDDLTSEAFNEMYREEPSMGDVAVELLWKNTSAGVLVEGYVLRVPYDTVKDIAPGCSAQEGTGKCGRGADGLSRECPGNEALTSGLLSLQWAVETALVQTFKDPGFKPPALQIQMMPVPFYRPGATNTQLLICISMVMALAPLAYLVTVTIVTEQKTGAKVMFKVMGIRESVFWLSWWVTYTVTVLVVSVAVTIMLALAGFLGSAGLAMVLLMLLLYGASLLSFSFLVAVFFTSPQVAGLVCSVLTVLQGLLYLAVSLTRPDTPLSLESPLTAPPPAPQSAVPFPVQLVLSLFSPVAFMLGLDQAVYDHEQDVASHIVNGAFPLVAAVLMLVLDTVLYGCLAVYLHLVRPNEYRLPLKPWFCFTPSYWRGRRHDVNENEVIPCDFPEGPHIEPMSEAQAEVRALRVRDLSKKFSKGKQEPIYGLNGLDLDIYEGQVTCVLGHPEAGKTTLLNILAGVMQPISGVAYVYDLNACDVHDHKELVKTISYCPQRDVIPDEITVEEHVRMTAFLCGLKVEGLEDMIRQCLRDLQLEEQRKKRAGDLSAGQRRRLCLAAALLPDTKVLLLDEPTLGLDGEERRRVWELLHAKKALRVILCCTRYMEEAQYFADRIVVLSRGRLRCVGSWQFLRQQFSVGYLLNMTVKAGSSSDRLLRAVKSHMRGASLVRCDDTSVIIMLPLSQAARLSGLLKMLESKERGSEYLGITEFTLTMTSLEHVFWKMAAEEEAGHVFISPLLTPPDDSFASCDDVRGNGSRRSSGFPPSDVPRIVMPSPLDDLSRRFSAFPAARQLGLDGNDYDSRRKSAFPRLQERDDVMGRQERKGSGHSAAGSIGRRLSNIFNKSTPQNKRRHGSVDLLAPPSPHSHGSPNPSGVSRRATLFAEALLKRRKDGQRSPMAARIKKSNTSHTLHDLANSDRAVEESSAFSGGAVLPTSLAARRATVAAFKDFRRSISLQSNLSGLVSVSEQPTMPSDPMSRLHVLDSYDRSRPPSISDISTFGGSAQLSACSSMEEISFSPIEEAGKDPEKAPSPPHPAKIGEVLANMTAPKTGARLGLQRLGAMVRLRIWLILRAKCWLLLRLVFPALFAGIGVGLAYLTQPLNPTPSQPGKRIHLFGISHLMYRNRTGGDISHLEADFSRTLDGPERMTHYSADSWDTGQPLESLLDVLQQDGDSYRLNYNATCALALPHMTSFLAHLMRHSPTPTPLNPHNQAYLGPQLSAWLQAWPPRSALRSERPWDWVPILFLGLGLLLTTTHCAVRLVRERKDKLRNYLGVTGVSRLTYYGSAFIVDAIELLVVASFVIIVCAVSEVAMLEVKGSIESVALLMILSVPVTILTVYLASFAFSTTKTCRLLLPIVLILVTVPLFCLVHFLDRGDTEELSTVLHYVFCVVWPPYLRFGTLHYIARAGDLGETSADVSPFQPHINVCYIMLLVDIVVLPCLVLLLDKLMFRTPTLSCCGGGKKKSSLVDHHLQGDDEGVTSEIQRVQDLDKNMNKTSWPWLVLEAVSKVWSDNSSTGPGSRRFVKAVDNVSLTVDAGQLVAVLGPRGAGKTTLLDLVLGSNTPSDGSLHVDTEKTGAGQWKERMGQTGYCPQYDPLWAPLTVDQHVLLMADLQGLHRQDLDNFRECLYHDLDLDSYQWQKVTQLSDCEKRKLSFAMSMLGRQSAMILDEPSSGMDPRSRRLYWDAVKHFLQCSERSGVVSTHSVEEATTLCSRLALVVNGRIQHLGTEEELKRRCRQTFSLEVRFRGWQEGSQQRMDMLLLLLKEHFPSLTLVEHFHQRALCRVHLAASDLSLASTFDALDTVKRTLELEEFTFSQYTLDQLFLDLSRQQKQGDSKFLTLDELLPKPSSQHTHPPHLNPAATTPDAPVGVANTDPAQQPRDVKDEGGASCQDDVSDADAAVGMVVIRHYNGDDGGGGVACGEEGELQGAGAAAPVVFSLDGVDNLAFTTDGHDPPETQTSL